MQVIPKFDLLPLRVFWNPTHTLNPKLRGKIPAAFVKLAVAIHIEIYALRRFPPLET